MKHFLLQITHDALNAPLPILRAMYELQMKRTDSFFLEVQKRLASPLIYLHQLHLHLSISVSCYCPFFFFFFPDLMETKSKPTRQSVHWHRNGNLPGVLTPRSETPRRWTPIWSWCHVWWVWLNLPLKNKKGPVKSANATNLKRRLQKTPLKLIMLYMGQSQILFSDNYG